MMHKAHWTLIAGILAVLTLLGMPLAWGQGPAAPAPVIPQGITADGGQWVIETIDSAGDVGQYTALALDAADRPRISYYDASNGGLKYATYDGAAWQTEVVDGSGDAGQYTSLVLDDSGNAHVSYYDVTNGDLKLAYWTGAEWQVETADSAGNVGQYSSIDLVDETGVAEACYMDAGNWDLRCWSNGSGHTVDSVGAVGAYTSFDSWDNLPHVSYLDYSQGALKYTYFDGDIWQKMVVDDNGDVGWYTSLAIGPDGQARISYYDAGTGDLKFARQVGYNTWVSETVDSAGDVGTDTALVLDAAGNPHISYYDETNLAVKYAYYDSATWQIETVEAGLGDYGGHTSLALDSYGMPHISYYDWNERDLHYAHQGVRAGFAPAAAPSCPGDTVAFTNTTAPSGTFPIAFHWNFGDGATSDLPNPAHTYNQEGVYTVILTATAYCGRDVFTDVVTVYGAPQAGFENTTPACTGAPVIFTSTAAGSGTLSFLWNFGDGDVSVQEHPTHTYWLAGIYPVTQDVANECGADSFQRFVPVHMIPESASFIWLPLEPNVGQEVTFSGQAQGTVPLTVTWDFGDGSSFSGPSAWVVTHTYAVSGFYAVAMTATNGCGASVARHQIGCGEVCQPVGSVEFTWIPARLLSGQPVTFTGQAAGTAPLFTWDFGDGTSANGQEATHTYAVPATYRVVLTATNACSDDGIWHDLAVELSCTAPQGTDLSSSAPVPAGDEVHFTGIFTAGAEPLTFTWFFGDGSSAAGRNITHTYQVAGDYPVMLIVQNPCGSDLATGMVEITARIWHIYLPLVAKNLYLGDDYEPDGTPPAAKPLPLGGTQVHTIDPAGDVDWVYVDLAAGQSYYFATGGLGPDTDTALALYAADGQTQLAENDDCGAERWSCLDCTAATSGRYYLKVRDYLPNMGGPAHTYTLSAAQQ